MVTMKTRTGDLTDGQKFRTLLTNKDGYVVANMKDEVQVKLDGVLKELHPNVFVDHLVEGL